MNVIKTKSFEEYRSKVVESNLPTLLTASKHIHFYFKFLFLPVMDMVLGALNSPGLSSHGYHIIQKAPSALGTKATGHTLYR